MHKRKLVEAILQDNLVLAMNEDYDRIYKGIRHNPLMELYDIVYIDIIIDYFQEREEYEKCSLLLEKKNSVLDHQNNYFL